LNYACPKCKRKLDFEIQGKLEPLKDEMFLMVKCFWCDFRFIVAAKITLMDSISMIRVASSDIILHSYVMMNDTKDLMY
jgi:DNA-directed RNA polymerase subunit RPC12/RpoP